MNAYDIVLRDEDSDQLTIGMWRLRAEVPDRGVVSNWIELRVEYCVIDVVMSAIRVANGQNEAMDLAVTASVDSGRSRKWPEGRESQEIETGQTVRPEISFKRFQHANGTTRTVDINVRAVDFDDFLRLGDDFGEASGQIMLDCAGSSTVVAVTIMADEITCAGSEPDPFSDEARAGTSCTTVKLPDGRVDVTFVGRIIGATGPR